MMYEDIESILIDRNAIQARIKEMAAQLEKDYKGESVVMICILRGASVFFCDLVRELDLDVRFEFMSVSSYGASTTSSGEVRIVKDINAPLSGKNVIIVEDIIDSGNTLSYLKRLLEQRRKVELQGDYIGFTVEDKFLVGYGLDYAEKYRNLKDIGILKPEIYQK